MQENIKEDIKNIEEIIELSKEEIDAKDENITAILDIEDLISLEHILQDYKRVLKENEELEEINNELEAEKNEAIRRYNFETIPKQKVKDKIEELNREIGKSIDNSKGGLDEEFIEKARELLVQKRILQELLEGRKI